MIKEMIKIAVCDDDVSLLKRIAVLLDQYCTEYNREMMYTFFAVRWNYWLKLKKECAGMFCF